MKNALANHPYPIKSSHHRNKKSQYRGYKEQRFYKIKLKKKKEYVHFADFDKEIQKFFR